MSEDFKQPNEEEEFAPDDAMSQADDTLPSRGWVSQSSTRVLAERAEISAERGRASLAFVTRKFEGKLKRDGWK